MYVLGYLQKCIIHMCFFSKIINWELFLKSCCTELFENTIFWFNYVTWNIIFKVEKYFLAVSETHVKNVKRTVRLQSQGYQRKELK